MSWDDIDIESPLTTVVLQEPSDPVERRRIFETAWAALTDRQRGFLKEWTAHRFNVDSACRSLGALAPSKFTVSGWKRKNEHYAFVCKAIKADAVSDVLERERLVLRQDDCAEQLLAPKPILYQGVATGFYENQAAAAAKVNETLLRIGGHLRDEQAAAPMVGPALIVQVTNRIGEIESHTVVGVIPQLPAPDDAWLSTR